MTQNVTLWRKFADQYIEVALLDRAQSPLFGRWHYENGCVLKALLDIWETTKEIRYMEFVRDCAAELVNDFGVIRGYRRDDFNLDNINEGKILFDVYAWTGDDRYRLAIETLIEQMEFQPKTQSGGFWHKKIYPHQMWLDGVYMAAPFLAKYAAVFDSPEWVDLAVDQIQLIYRKTKDPITGLIYHAWDESKTQRWANSETGCSPHFWGRAVGWFLMALVDVLEYLPVTHKGRGYLEDILNELSASVINMQNEDTGLWYQILDRQEEKNNYTESSCSSMFVYAFAKGIRTGLLPKSWDERVAIAYQGIVNHLIRAEGGTIQLIACNAVAGLGGYPYRDGSLRYYLSEPVVNNEPKAVAAFMMASLEIEKSGLLLG